MSISLAEALCRRAGEVQMSLSWLKGQYCKLPHPAFNPVRQRLPVDCRGVVVPHFLLLSIVADACTSTTSEGKHTVSETEHDSVGHFFLFCFKLTHANVIFAAITPDVIGHLKP